MTLGIAQNITLWVNNIYHNDTEHYDARYYVLSMLSVMFFIIRVVLIAFKLNVMAPF